MRMPSIRSLDRKDLASSISIICIIILQLLASPAMGWSLHRDLGTQPRGYFNLLLNKYISWYSQNIFNYTEKLTKTELELITEAIHQIDISGTIYDSDMDFTRFAFGIGYVDSLSKIQPSLFISFSKNNSHLKSLLQRLISEKGLHLPAEYQITDIYSLKWNFNENELSLIFRKHMAAMLVESIYKYGSPKRKVLWQKQDKRPKELANNFYSMGAEFRFRLVEEKKPDQFIIEAKHFSDLFAPPLLGKIILQFINDFRFYPNFILIDKTKNMTFYYP